MGEILLRAENIDKHFGITHALDNVSFTFNKGEIHALIGENGSGKSTLTSCLTGIYQKDSGKFILEGKEITATNQVEANQMKQLAAPLLSTVLNLIAGIWME